MVSHSEICHAAGLRKRNDVAVDFKSLTHRIAIIAKGKKNMKDLQQPKGTFLHGGLSRYATLTPNPLQGFSPATRASNDTSLSPLLVVASRSLWWIRALAVLSLSLLAEVPPDANRRSPRDPRLGAFRGTDAIWLSKEQSRTRVSTTNA